MWNANVFSGWGHIGVELESESELLYLRVQVPTEQLEQAERPVFSYRQIGIHLHLTNE